jgi:hypothetical protein
LIIVEKSINGQASPDVPPLLERQMRERLASDSKVAPLRIPLRTEDAERLMRLQFQCMLPGAAFEDVREEAEQFLLSMASGERANVLEYRGKSELDIKDRGLTLHGGDWMGYIRFKKTGYFDEDVVGDALMRIGSGQRQRWAELVGKGFPRSYSAAAYMAGDPKSQDVAFLEMVSVLPQLRRLGLVEKVLGETLCGLREEGVKYAVAYARVPSLHKEAHSRKIALEKLDEYVWRADERGLNQDVGIRFHQKAGGKLICAIPDCASDDTKSVGQGALILYDLNALKGR